MNEQMTSLERTLAAINHQEPDRVPLFLLLSLYGAKELGMTPKDYFAEAQNIVAAQLRMKEKYRNDCIYTFFYAAIEVEAFGGEVIFVEDGPPIAGSPFITSYQDIARMEVPDIQATSCLARVLDATRQLKQRVTNTAPIIGVVMSPYSLPIMQMGFEKYLELLYFHPDHFHCLMKKNQAFCLAWANAQIAAGATAICYFNPLASPNMIEKETYLATGYPIDCATLPQIMGPTATHLASGIALPLLDEIANTGTKVVGVGHQEDLSGLKHASAGRLCVLGNLNGIEMVKWSREQVHEEVRKTIRAAGKGGGLIVSDGHGEIPLQVPEQVLLEISEAVRLYGTYPLDRIQCNG